MSGIISNEFETNEIQISSGDNIFNLPEGYYEFEFLMDDPFVPWGKTIELESDQEVSVAYESGMIDDLSESWPWSNSVGNWCMIDCTLRSQEGQWYDNGDTLSSSYWTESDLIDISGSNRAVV